MVLLTRGSNKRLLVKPLKKSSKIKDMPIIYKIPYNTKKKKDNAMIYDYKTLLFINIRVRINPASGSARIQSNVSKIMTCKK